MLHRLRDMPRRLEGPLVDGDLTLRLPTLADRHRLADYAADAASLEGGWLPLGEAQSEPEVWAAWAAREFALGWTPLGSRYGGTLVVDSEQEPFVGLIYLVRRQATVAEIAYGVAPEWRGRGVATRAAQIATEWALTDGSFDRVEARIDLNHTASRRVIEKAGFRLEETFKTYVEGTGETCDDALYVRP